MNPAWTWLLITLGLVLFISAAYLDDREVKQFTAPSARRTAEEARPLWIRIILRQVAAFMLVLLLDALSAEVNQSVPALQQQVSRFFLSMAEAANLWQMPRYYRLIKQAVARARALQAWRGGSL
jgi:hypothetical protein